MTLLMAVLALVIEQFRPLDASRWVNNPLDSWAGFFESRLNDGQYRQGLIAWMLAVALPAALVQGLYVFLLFMQPLLAMLLGIAVLYLTMGFRQFSHFFTDIQLALRTGELDRARALLGKWRKAPADRLSSSEIARLAIEEALVGSHRHVFAPLACFALLGPGGALLYRLSSFFALCWSVRDNEPVTIPVVATGHFGEFAQRVFGWIDWLPVRMSAAGFAIVGDFEDAVFCWRSQASNWSDAASGILIASGAGAMGVRLGQPIQDDLGIGDRPEMGIGDEADADYMQSTVGLVWRTLLLGLMVMALVWVSGWVG